MELFEKKFKKYINENEEESYYDPNSLLAYIIEYKDELSDYVDVKSMETDFAMYAADVIGEKETAEADPELFNFENINEYFPEVVDAFFKREGEGKNWLWLSALGMLSAGFFGRGRDANLASHKYTDNRADNKWKNWYEDFGKETSILDADEMAYLFASWAGVDTDTEDISEWLEQANKLSYPLRVEKSYGMQSYSDEKNFPVITTSAGYLFYEDRNTDTEMYSDADDSFRSESKPFDPRANMFDIFKGPDEAITKFLSKFGN